MMKRNLSQHEQEVFDKIYRDNGNKLVRLVRYKRDLAEDITLIDSVTSYASIPYLAPLVVCDEYSLRVSAIAKLALMLDELPHGEWNWLDEAIRKNFYGYNSSRLHRWHNLGIHNLGAYHQDDIESNTILALLTCHFNGYIREQALKMLVSRKSSSLVPILFVRANDWVQKVRLLACSGLWNQVDTLPADELLKSILLVDQLKNRYRGDHSKLLNFIEDKLSSSQCIENLKDLSCSYDHRVSKIAFDLCMRLIDDKSDFFYFASSSPNPIIRAKLIKLSITVFSDYELKVYLNKFLHDCLGLIRKKSLYVLVDLFPAEIKDILYSLLFDKNRGVRASAQFYLRRLYDEKPIDIYKNHLNSKSQINIVPIILGVGETGEKSDWILIEPYLSHAEPKVRASVLASIGFLNLDSHAGILYENLLSDMPVEVRSSRDSLINLGIIDLNKLKEIYFIADKEASLKIIRKMINANDKWEGLILILKGFDRFKKDVSSIFIKELKQWLAKRSSHDYCSHPKISQSEELMRLTSKVTPYINDSNIKIMLAEKIKFVELNYNLTLKLNS